MYNVIIVDDELPALRFVRSIIEQYGGGYQVVCAASSAETALEYLQNHSVDLMITDISMHGMNGIELAQVVRKLHPGIHMVIISGYGEFDFAQGAIQAGVDAYLLKPVSIVKLRGILESIKTQLETANNAHSASLLPAIACGLPHDEEAALRCYGKKNYRFAYVRLGNLDMELPKTLTATSLVPSADSFFQVLRGRDENEFILIAEDSGTEDFLTNLSVYVTAAGNLPTWTAVYTPLFRSIDSLQAFIELAILLIYNRTVIGKHQIIQFTGGNQPERIPLPPSELKQLSYFITSEKLRLIKEYFASLAQGWESGKMAQRQVWHMVRQIIHQAAAVSSSINARLEDILLELNAIIRSAASYAELMDNTYSMLFDTEDMQDRRLTTSELYEKAVSYISENYAQPLSMQSVCDELGISQTYLSRIFRKYSNTTFNVYLTQCRIEAAKKLLRDKPNLLLRDVAACVGYDDSSYFSKVFRQYTGITPTQWAYGEE